MGKTLSDNGQASAQKDKKDYQSIDATENNGDHQDAEGFDDEAGYDNAEDPDYERDPHGNSFGEAQRSSSSDSQSGILASAGGQEEEDDIEALGLRDCIEAGGRDWDRDDLQTGYDKDVIRFRGDDDCLYPQNQNNQSPGLRSEQQKDKAKKNQKLGNLRIDDVKLGVLHHQPQSPQSKSNMQGLMVLAQQVSNQSTSALLDPSQMNKQKVGAPNSGGKKCLTLNSHVIQSSQDQTRPDTGTGLDSYSIAVTPTAAATGSRLGGKGSSSKKRHGLPLNGKKHNKNTPKGKQSNIPCADDESNQTFNSSRNSMFESNESKIANNAGGLVPAFKRNNLFNQTTPEKKGPRGQSSAAKQQLVADSRRSITSPNQEYLSSLGLVSPLLSPNHAVSPPSKETTPNVVTAAAANQRFITITGYVDNITTFINRSLCGKKCNLKQLDKKQDQDRVFVQVPKRKHHGKHYTENDPRIDKMQLLIREKTEDMLNPDGPRNHLLKYLPPFLPNILFVKAMKTLESTHAKYKQLPKGPSLIPSHLIVSMKKKAVREKARPPKFGGSFVNNKKKDSGDAAAVSSAQPDFKADELPEEVKTIEVNIEETSKKDPETPNESDSTRNTSNADQPNQKPQKPKVHIYSQGIPFFYAHKWVYEDPASGQNSGMNSAMKKDQTNRLIKKRTIPVGPSFLNSQQQQQQQKPQNQGSLYNHNLLDLAKTQTPYYHSQMNNMYFDFQTNDYNYLPNKVLQQHQQQSPVKLPNQTGTASVYQFYHQSAGNGGGSTSSGVAGVGQSPSLVQLQSGGTSFFVRRDAMFQTPTRAMGGARNEAGEVMGTMESVGEEEDGRSPAGKGMKVFNGKYLEGNYDPFTAQNITPNSQGAQIHVARLYKGNNARMTAQQVIYRTPDNRFQSVTSMSNNVVNSQILQGLQANVPSQLLGNLNKTLAYVSQSAGNTSPHKLEGMVRATSSNTYMQNPTHLEQINIAHEAFMSSASHLQKLGGRRTGAGSPDKGSPSQLSLTPSLATFDYPRNSQAHHTQNSDSLSTISPGSLFYQHKQQINQITGQPQYIPGQSSASKVKGGGFNSAIFQNYLAHVGITYGQTTTVNNKSLEKDQLSRALLQDPQVMMARPPFKQLISLGFHHHQQRPNPGVQSPQVKNQGSQVLKPATNVQAVSGMINSLQSQQQQVGPKTAFQKQEKGKRALNQQDRRIIETINTS